MKNSRLKFHLLQFASVNGHPLRTLERVQKMISPLRVKAQDWLVFPEMWPAGFRLDEKLRQQKENKECAEWLRSFAQEKRCFMVGSMLEISQGRAYNSSYVLNPQGRLLRKYRKIHLFRLGEEHRKFSPGTRPALLRFPWGKMGLGICYDLRFPELFRLYSKKAAKLILLPSAWPRERLPHFLTLLQARAIENQCFVVGTNKIGHHDSGIPYGGHSAVFGPWG